MRYLDNVVLHFGGDQQYFMGIQREVHITDPAPKLPLAGDIDGKSVHLAVSSLHCMTYELATTDFLHLFSYPTFEFILFYSSQPVTP